MLGGGVPLCSLCLFSLLVCFFCESSWPQRRRTTWAPMHPGYTAMPSPPPLPIPLLPFPAVKWKAKGERVSAEKKREREREGLEVRFAFFAAGSGDGHCVPHVGVPLLLLRHPNGLGVWLRYACDLCRRGAGLPHGGPASTRGHGLRRLGGLLGRRAASACARRWDTPPPMGERLPARS